MYTKWHTTWLNWGNELNKKIKIGIRVKIKNLIT